MKKLARYIVWILGGAFIAFLLLPFIFKDRFIEVVKEQIESYVNAEIEFDETRISLFREFPSINIGFNNLDIRGIDDFDSLLLLHAREFNMTTDWKSMIRSKLGIEIHKFNITDAHLNLLINHQDLKNYDIWKEAKAKSDGSIRGNIRAYSFKNCKLTYQDQVSGTILEINKLNHHGSGRFEDIVFNLSTNTSIQDFTLNYNGIDYLHNARLEGIADISADIENNIYSIGENNFELNDLRFSITGDIELHPDSYLFNLDINAPNNKVTEVISIIPHVFSSGFDKIDSDGTGSVHSSVKGQYKSSEDIFPAIDFKALIQDGFMASREHNVRLDDIDLEANIKASEGNWDDIIIDIPSFDFSTGDKAIHGKLHLTDLYGNTNYEFSVIGETDLYTIREIMQLDQLSSMTGDLKSDFSLRGKQSDIETRSYQNLRFAGNLSLTDFEMTGSHSQVISVDHFQSAFSPEQLVAEFSNANYNGSDFTGNMKIEDPLLFLGSDSKTKLSLSANSARLDLNNIYNSKEDSSYTDDQGSKIPFEFDVEYQADKIIYKDYNIQDLHIYMHNDGNQIIVDPSTLSLDESAISFRGNLDEYYLNKQGLSGKIFLDAGRIDLNQYQNMDSNRTQGGIIEIPSDIDLEIYSEINNIQYNQLNLENTEARIEVSEGMASLTGGKAKLFQGIVQFDGSYDPRDKTNPLFNFKYNMAGLKFGEMFHNSQTFKALAPIAEYIDGAFNSTLVISGPLGEDLLPKLDKISASGYMETVQGKIKGFKPLEVLAAALGIEKLKEWDIKDSKNWFEVVKGIIYIKEHDYEFSDMNFKLAGSHALDQTIDYTIKAIIPRERIAKGQLGAELESSFDRIEEEARNRGVDIDLGENIYFDIFITGSIKEPDVKVVPTGSGGESIDELVREEIETRVEEVKEEAKETLDNKTEEIKDSLSKTVEEKLDTLESKAEEKLDSATQVIKDKVLKGVESKIDSTQKELIDSLSKKVTKEVDEIFGKKAQSEIDSIKSKIKDWNPFKKKKKEGN